MGPIALRRELRRRRRRLTAVFAVLVCSLAVAAHHSGPAMGDGHHDGISAAVEMCLAAFVAVGAGVVVVVIGLIALGRWRPPLRLAPSALSLFARVPLPRARAGPGLLAVLCVSRR